MFKKFSEKLKSPYLKNVGSLVTGASIAQLITVAATPMLSRVYGPAELGVLGVFVSATSILAIVASLRYELAIPLVTHEEAPAMLAGALLVTCIVSIMVAISVFVGGSALRVIGLGALEPYKWTIPLATLAVGTYTAFSYWAGHNGQFAVVGRTKISQSAYSNSFQLIFGLLGGGVLGLLLGFIVSQSSGTLRLAKLFRRATRDNFNKISLPKICRLLKFHRRFPLASMSGIINRVGINAPSLMLIALYGAQVAGWYTLGQRLLSLPMLLVGRAVAQVYITDAAQSLRKSNPRLKTKFLKTSLTLFAIGIIPCAVCGTAGPYLFEKILGHKWSEAGVYAQILSGAYLLQFCISPMSQTLNIIGRQATQFGWDVFRLVTIVAGLLFSKKIMQMDAVGAIRLLSATMILTYAVQFFLCFSALKTLDKSAKLRAT